MTSQHLSSSAPSCTAFDATRQVASGPYERVALALKAYVAEHPYAAVLVFDDGTGRQTDLDLSGSDAEIAERLKARFPAAEPQGPRARGRPRLGVVAREVTLLPRHWDWLAAQQGGASVTLRKLVEEARRRAPSDQATLRRLQERAYNFMSAMAGDFPHFEEAARALFARDSARLKDLIAEWPEDVRAHVVRLSREGT
jgi:hypothetical protein